MATGDLACSTPVYCETEAAISAAVVSISLTAATDFLFVVPWKNGAMVFRAERAA